ncbi:MAG: hypothetical protein M3044_19065 [Thermoproteota archaeon]|jgi:hypothetical protein|nr:hypothetical protein [Thermoproteota archaeon]
MTNQVNISMKLQRRLSIGLAAATLVVALLFFAGSVLLMQSWFAALVAQTGLTLESFVAVFAISVIALSTGAFVISWKQRSFLGAGLLAASGIIFMIHPLTNFMIHQHIATGHSGAIPWGPILVVILGLGILGLGISKGIRTVRTTRTAMAPAKRS